MMRHAVLATLLSSVGVLSLSSCRTARPPSLPDLVPVHSPSAAAFCDVRPTGPGGSIPSLLITVKNQGTAFSGPSVTRVAFPARQSFPGAPTFTFDVPALAPGGTYEHFVQIPQGGYVPDLVFMISIDPNGFVESDYANNS